MKRGLIVALVALSIIVVAAVTVPMLVRDRVSEVVRHEAGSLFAGRFGFQKLNISLLRHFPHASVDLKGISVTGVGQFRSDTVVLAERVSIVVDVRSLWSDEFKVSKVTLVRPALRAHKLASGAENWHLLRDSIPARSGSDLLSVRFALRDVKIKEGTVRYVDDSTSMHSSTSQLSVRLQGNLHAPRSVLDLRLRAGQIDLASGGVTLLSQADVRMDALLDANFATQRFTFKENTLILNALRMSLGGWIDLAVRGAVTIDLRADCSTVQFKEVLSMFPAFYRRDFNNLAASGDVTLSAWARGTAYESRLPAFEMRLDVRNGRFQYSSLPKAVTDIRIAARAVSDGGTFDNTSLDISEFSMKIAGKPIRGSLKAAHPMSDLRVDASMAGRLDMEALRKVYPFGKQSQLSGVVTADVRFAASLSDIDSQRYDAIRASGVFVVERLSAQVAGLPPVHIRRAAAAVSPAALTFGELSMTVGRSNLTANGQMTNYMAYLLDGKPLGGRMYVKSDLLDMNEIMAASSLAGQVDTTRLPALVIPCNLSLSLATDVRDVRLHKMRLADFSGGVHFAGGTVVLDGLTMKAFGGQVLASGNYSTALDPHHPELTLALDLVHGSFARMGEELGAVQRLVPMFRQAEGNCSMTLDLTAVFDRYMSFELERLHARGEIRSSEVQLQQVPLFLRLASVLHADKLRVPTVHDLVMRFSVTEGVIRVHPFDLKTQGPTLTLEGTTGLDHKIDYTIHAHPSVGSADSTPLELRVDGTFNVPRIRLGTDAEQ